MIRKTPLAMRLVATIVTVCVFASSVSVSAQSVARLPLTNDDVIQMVKANLSENLILSQIRDGRTTFDLSTAEVIRLSTAGVSDVLIAAMRVPSVLTAAPPTPPVVVLPVTPPPAAVPVSQAPRNAAVAPLTETDLGVMYSNGKGVAQDYVEAVAWFRKAAEQGDASGQNNLGFMYLNGRGVSRDYAQAFAWFRKAAEQGHAVAQFGLSSMYYNGLGVRRDYAQAFAWCLKAAEQGDAGAQQSLGNLYENGRGTLRDYPLAHMWFNLASERTTGHERESAKDGRSRVAKQMTPQKILDALRMAREWQAAFETRKQ